MIRCIRPDLILGKVNGRADHAARLIADVRAMPQYEARPIVFAGAGSTDLYSLKPALGTGTILTDTVRLDEVVRFVRAFVAPTVARRP